MDYKELIFLNQLNDMLFIYKSNKFHLELILLFRSELNYSSFICVSIVGHLKLHLTTSSVTPFSEFKTDQMVLFRSLNI